MIVTVRCISESDAQALEQLFCAFAELIQQQQECGYFSLEHHIPRGMIEPLRAARAASSQLSSGFKSVAFDRFPPYTFSSGKTEHAPEREPAKGGGQ